jgi:hypothetical protein
MYIFFLVITNTIEKDSGIEKLIINGKGNNTVAMYARRNNTVAMCASGNAFRKI